MPLLVMAIQRLHYKQLVVELLLSQGADVNVPPTGDGHTALGETCDSGYAEIAQLLLEHGAEVNPNIKPLSGKPVLTSAAQKREY